MTHRFFVTGLILLATLLETGGDSVVRLALGATHAAQRPALFALGAALLFGYGFSLVSAPLDFGRLFGVYIALLFIVAQTMNALVFKTPPTLPVCVGGLLIIVGGVLATCWKVKPS